VKTTSLRRAATVAVALGLVATACGGGGGDGSSAPATPTSADSAAVDRDASLRFAINYGYSSLDPHKSLSPGGDEAWLKPVYDTLLAITDRKGTPTLVPRLATSFEVSDDGMRVSFVLREGVTFQDGAPFDASAVKANIERAKGPTSTVATTLASIERVEVVDTTHVVFHLSTPDPAVPWLMASDVTGDMISPAAFEGDLSAKPVGTGPMKLVSARPGGDVVYERWDGHWDESAALVKRYTISTVFDANARLNGLRSGTYDAAFVSQQDQGKTLEGQGYHYLRGVVPSPFSMLLNASKAPFDDVRVRRALWAAFDRKAISEKLLEGNAPPAYQPFEKGIFGHDPSLERDPYDPAAARKLIQEAGATGAKVRVIQVLTPPIDAMAEVVQQSLGDIGLDVELVPLSYVEARAAWSKGGAQAIVTGLRGGYDPSQRLTTAFLGGDNVAPAPPELLALSDEAKALPFRSDEQREAYQAISRWLVENPVHVPITRTVHVVVARPNVVGSENLLMFSVSRVDIRRVGIAG
jgi:peptide/nickel transport system substrate-binding protein